MEGGEDGKNAELVPSHSILFGQISRRDGNFDILIEMMATRAEARQARIDSIALDPLANLLLSYGSLSSIPPPACYIQLLALSNELCR